MSSSSNSPPLPAAHVVSEQSGVLPVDNGNGGAEIDSVDVAALPPPPDSPNRASARLSRSSGFLGAGGMVMTNRNADLGAERERVVSKLQEVQSMAPNPWVWAAQVDARDGAAAASAASSNERGSGEVMNGEGGVLGTVMEDELMTITSPGSSLTASPYPTPPVDGERLRYAVRILQGRAVLRDPMPDPSPTASTTAAPATSGLEGSSSPTRKASHARNDGDREGANKAPPNGPGEVTTSGGGSTSSGAREKDGTASASSSFVEVTVTSEADLSVWEILLQAVQTEGGAMALVSMLPHTQGGLECVAMGLFHTDQRVRGVCRYTLSVLEGYDSTRPAVQCLNGMFKTALNSDVA